MITFIQGQAKGAADTRAAATEVRSIVQSTFLSSATVLTLNHHHMYAYRTTVARIAEEVLPGKETGGSREQRRDQRKAVGEALHGAHRDKEEGRVRSMFACAVAILGANGECRMLVAGRSDHAREDAAGRRQSGGVQQVEAAPYSCATWSAPDTSCVCSPTLCRMLERERMLKERRTDKAQERARCES